MHTAAQPLFHDPSWQSLHLSLRLLLHAPQATTTAVERRVRQEPRLAGLGVGSANPSQACELSTRPGGVGGAGPPPCAERRFF